MDGDGIGCYQTLGVLGSGRFGVVKKVMRRSDCEVGPFFSRLYSPFAPSRTFQAELLLFLITELLG
jgi:hypothetical protein